MSSSDPRGGPADDALAETISSEEAERAAATAGAPARSPAHLPEVPTTAYTRLSEFARGGLGRIVRARDQRTGREVAIKEMLDGDDAETAARFVREALVTANLQHPAIVPVYEVGRWPDGQPFYAMKLVRGRPLDAVIRDSATLDARLALVPHAIAVADALAYAHGQRVIHRDLKPQNVLVGDFGETVVIDWGLARRSDDEDASLPPVRPARALDTAVGAVLGTPAYMAPEQARGERVDERADVYAIGALLYHVLAGQPPFGAGRRGRDLDELLAQVRNEPPPRLGDLVPAVPPDLAAVVERAMARRPDERYPSAAELAVDLRRFRDGQLVLAYRYTPAQRLARFVRRHRAPLAVTVVALAALGTLGGVSLRAVLRSREQARVERREAARARDEATERLRAGDIDRARGELAADRADRALPLLGAADEIGALEAGPRFMAARILEELPVAARRSGELVSADVAGSGDLLVLDHGVLLRWDPRRDAVVWRAPGVTRAAVVVRDFAAAAQPGYVSLLWLCDGHEVRRLSLPRGATAAVSIAGDAGQRWLAALTDDARVTRYDLDGREPDLTFPAPTWDRVISVARDGAHVLVERRSEGLEYVSLLDGRGRAKVVCENCGAIAAADLVAGVEVASVKPHAAVRLVDWDGRERARFQPVTRSGVAVLELAPDTLALGAVDGTIEVFDRATRALRWRTTIADVPTEMAFDEDGRLWIVGPNAGLFAFDRATGMPLDHLPTALGESVLVSSVQRGIATASRERGVAVWPIRALPRAALAPTASRVRLLAFAADGTVVSASNDGTVARWDREGRALGRFAAHAAQIASLQVLGDGRILTAAHDETAVIWDAASGRAVRRFHHGRHAEVSPDGRTLATADERREVALWDVASGARLRTLGTLPRAILRVRWSPHGRLVAAIDDDGQLVAWEAASGRAVRELPAIGQSAGLDFVVSHDERWVMRCALALDHVLLEPLVDGAAARALVDAPTGDLYGAEFSPDDALLALGGQGYVGVWDLSRARPRMLVHTQTLSAKVALSPDAALLYSIGVDRRVRVWDVATEAQLDAVPVPDEAYDLALSPDGQRAAVGTLGAALLVDTSSFAGARGALTDLARSRTHWRLDDAGRLVEKR